MLAFVVLYNLNNISITERQRELATLKVLGFYDREVSAYVNRENVVLTAVGIVLGCVLKYGIIMLASSFFYGYFGSDTAQTVMLVVIVAVIVISFVASYVKKKRSGLSE